MFVNSPSECQLLCALFPANSGAITTLNKPPRGRDQWDCFHIPKNIKNYFMKTRKKLQYAIMFQIVLPNNSNSIVYLKSSCWLRISNSSILSMDLADSLHSDTKPLRSSRASLPVASSELHDGRRLEMASVRRGNLVILCMGNIRKECMARD